MPLCITTLTHTNSVLPPSPAPQVPTTSVVGNYLLRVEGNYPDTVGGTLFLNETRVHFSTRFLTILIQTSRPVYNGDQKGRLRGRQGRRLSSMGHSINRRRVAYEIYWQSSRNNHRPFG